MKITSRAKIYIGTLIIGLILGSIVGLAYINVKFYEEATKILNAIIIETDIRDMKNYDEMNELRKNINNLIKLTAEADIAQIEWNIDQEKTIEEALKFIKDNKESHSENVKEIKRIIYQMKKQKIEIKERLANVKTLNLKDIDKIEEASVLIVNKTARRAGTGTHIKIKGKSYILSCAHLVKRDKDEFFVYIDKYNRIKRPIKLVKMDKKIDITLWKIDNVEDLNYLEIADILPKAGSEVIVIGNPGRDSDIITDGIISKVGERRFLITNLIYHGNSGGAVVYKGKIIGVVIQGHWYMNTTTKTHVSYGVAIKLDYIQNFLKDIEPVETVNEKENSN